MNTSHNALLASAQPKKITKLEIAVALLATASLGGVWGYFFLLLTN